MTASLRFCCFFFLTLFLQTREICTQTGQRQRQSRRVRISTRHRSSGVILWCVLLACGEVCSRYSCCCVWRLIQVKYRNRLEWQVQFQSCVVSSQDAMSILIPSGNHPTNITCSLRPVTVISVLPLLHAAPYSHSSYARAHTHVRIRSHNTRRHWRQHGSVGARIY